MKTALELFAESLSEHLLAYNLRINLTETEAFKMYLDLEKEQIEESYNCGTWNTDANGKVYYAKNFNK